MRTQSPTELAAHTQPHRAPQSQPHIPSRTEPAPTLRLLGGFWRLPPVPPARLLRLRPSGRLPSLPPLTGEGSLLRLAGLVIGLWARPPAGRLLPTTINPRPHRHATLNGHSCVSVAPGAWRGSGGAFTRAAAPLQAEGRRQKNVLKNL